MALAEIWMPSLRTVMSIGPIWGLVGTLVAILLASLLVGRSALVAALMTLLGAVATAGLAWRAADVTRGGAWAGFAPLGGAPMLLMDNFSVAFIFVLALFLAAVTGLGVMGLGSARPNRALERNGPEFFTLLVGSAVGMALMTCTTNLLMIVLAIETASLPSYGIAGFAKDNKRSAEASLKYVVFGAVTSALMIYGVSLLYGYYGTLDVVRIGQMIAGGAGAERTALNPLMAVALFGVVAGIGFKISAVPFHFWCPDVFEGAPIEVTTWLSVASKAAGLGLFLRVMTALVQPHDTPWEALGPLSNGVGLMAAITCTVGNLAAFWQTNVKRMLAYSSIAHAGYMLMAGAILWRSTGETSVHPAFGALLTYIVVYLLMNLGAFSSVAMVLWATGQETMEAYRGLGRRAPLVALSLAACLFSLVGLPPMAGFWAKFYLLAALAQNGLMWLVIVAAINTLISLYYYARLAWVMYFVDDGQPAIETPGVGRALVVSVALVLAVVMLPAAGGLTTQAGHFARRIYPASAANEVAERPAAGVAAAASGR
ncbi:MAG: NADH-quinone oxidoreductase subunit N [Phycisphaerae bacterium]